MSRIMKVLMISSDRNIFKAGSAVSIRMQKYAKLFSSLDIIIFTNRKMKYTPFSVGGNVRVYPTNSLNRWMYVFDAMRIARSIMRVDVVSPQDPFEAGLVGVYVSRIMHSRLNIQIHTDPFSPYFKKTFLNKIRFYIMTYVIFRSDSIRVVSDRIRQSLLNRKVRLPIHVLPIYLRSMYRTYDNTGNLYSGPLRLLTVGRLEHEKNISQLISSLHILHKRNISFRLNIVGSGSLRHSLELQIKRLGLNDVCKLIGEVDDMSYVYQTNDVYVHTSFYEGFGATLYEAASYSVPIISTDVGLIGSVIPTTYITLVSPDAPLEISNAIEDVINNFDKYKQRAFALSDLVHKQHLSEDEYLRAYHKTLI